MWPLAWSLFAFAGSVLAIGFAGLAMTKAADQLADRTGWGEAIIGGVFVGATTSLSGSVMSFVSAWNGHAELAISNALGGIAAQTSFLALADFFHRKANLEHAAASESNLLQGVLLILLLSIPLLAIAGPVTTFWAVHPGTPILLLAYFFGIRLVSASHVKPMWKPVFTQETHPDEPEQINLKKNIKSLWLKFILLAGIVSAAGWILAHAAISLMAHTGLSATLVGGLLTAVSTSIPELVVVITAVRRGALTLAVGDIIGGNMFDTLMFAMSDIAFRKGSIYHAISRDQVYMIALSILLTAILMVGLLRREKHGIANIGTESFLVIVCYLAGFFWMLKE